ncbi:MAG TPA: hypothetical protein VLQ79_01055, partial [Myxococcaceae bacterium]|nr:hypothetical protein [Myxococcaceae bacterium]
MNVSARKTTATWLLAAALLVLVLPAGTRAQAVDGGTAAAAEASGSAGTDRASPGPAGQDNSIKSDAPVQPGSDVIVEIRLEGNRR